MEHQIRLYQGHIDDLLYKCRKCLPLDHLLINHLKTDHNDNITKTVLFIFLLFPPMPADILI